MNSSYRGCSATVWRNCIIFAAEKIDLRRIVRLLALGIFLPLSGVAQTLAISNGVQTYATLSNTMVTMTGKCSLYVTGTNNPISGSTINLNSSDAWFFLPNIRPSVVSASYLSQVKVNGAAAVAGSNCRLDEYVMGSVIIPQPPGFTPLQIFSGPNFLGASSQLGLYTYYTNTVLGALNRNIGSFRLKRGYAATLAQNADGTGASEVFVAQDGDLDVGVLAANLNRPISFVRVFPWRWTAKRGWADTAGLGGDGAVIKPYWFYDWGNGGNSSSDAEYAPMQWGGGYSTGINTKQKSTEVLGFNEPDSTAQANLSVAAATANWPAMAQSGLRLGAPAVSDSGTAGTGLDWIYSFMNSITNLGYRVDFIPIHWYKCGQSPSQLSNYLASVYQATGKPIWLTEFNYGANWCDVGGSLPPTPAQEATEVAGFINVLENAPFVERYSIYNWVTTNREMVLDDGVTLTPAGIIYRDTPTTIACTQTLPPGGSRSIAQFQFETNTLDSSGYGNNAFAVGIPGYVPGHSGQAVALDGTNSFLELPPNVANSTNFSFAAWVYWNGGAQWQRIFDFGDDTSHYLFLTPNSGSGTLRFAIKNGGGEQDVDTTVLPVGQWTHVAVTLTSGSTKIYTNGVLAVSSSSVTISPSSFNPAKNYLGKSQFTADPLFNGNLDEVQVADYVFTPAQIASLMTNNPPQLTTNFLSRGIAAPFVAFTTNVVGTASDPDPGDTLTYSKAGGPAWLSVNADGTLTGTPGSGDGGTNYFTVRATDMAGASAFAVVTVVVPITYASGTWSVNASGSWDDATKWSGAVIANGGNGGNYTADFSTLNIADDRTVSVDTTRSIGNLKFGDTSGTQNWTLTSSGPALTLDTGSSIQPTIVVNQNAATIAVPLISAFGFAKTGSGILILSNANTLGGTVKIDTSSTTVNEGSVRAAWPGAMSGVTNIQILDNNNGSSTLQLDGSSGSVTVTARLTVNCRADNVATIQNLGGTNTLAGFISLDVGGNLFNIESDAGLLVIGGTNQYTGTLTGGRTYNFTGAGDHLVTKPILAGANGAPINLTKSGAGTLTLAAVNTYTNGTTVSGGKLLVTGSITGAVAVASSATLGGTGTSRGPVTIQSNGTLAPGTNSSTVGTFTVSNSVTLQSGSFARMKISKSPATNDLLRVAGSSGALTLGGTLIVTNISGTSPASGDSFKLFSATSYSGAFANVILPVLPAGLGWNTNLLNTSGTISVVVIIIPTTTSLNSLSEVTYGTPVTLSATVSPAPASGETVTFNDGSAVLGTGTTSGGGVASYTTSGTQLVAGSHPITAVFGGDANYTGSTSGVSNQLVTAEPVTPVITLNGRAYDGTTTAASIAGETLTGVIGGDDVNLGGSGVVDAFTNQNAGSYSVNITGLSLSGTSAGNYTLTSSTTTATGVITPASSMTTITSSTNPAPYESDVTFTATVSGADTPGGSVQFLTNGVLFDTEALAAGTATSADTASLPPGTNNITGIYSGDMNYNGSTNTVEQVTSVPQFKGLNFGGNGLVLGGSGGLAGGTYYILVSSNMLAPLDQWTPVLTNHFDANGDFNFTNGMNTNIPQGFFILQVQ